jgi:exosortase C (VPDSG-CTERM-specific)
VKTTPVANSHGQNRVRLAESADSRRLLYFLAFAILLTVAFSQSLAALARHAAETDLHSHILLIPFISAYLLFIGRAQLPKEYAFSLGWIALLLLGGIAALLGGIGLFNPALSENDSLSFMAFSIVCFLTAGGFLLMGWKWMAAAAFPFGFLIFMVPLPDAVVNSLETASKLASAEVAALLFSITGTPTLREGTVFQLPGIALEVAQECSGIRSSWVLFITSVLASFLFLKSPWRRVVLVAFVIPLGILRNGIRILVIGLLCVHVDPQMIHSVIHKQGGPVFFALSMLPLFLLLWWLRKGERLRATNLSDLCRKSLQA